MARENFAPQLLLEVERVVEQREQDLMFWTDGGWGHWMPKDDEEN